MLINAFKLPRIKLRIANWFNWCDAAKIPGFLIWVINGRQYSGGQNLKELAKASGYKGDTNFKYAHVPRFF